METTKKTKKKAGPDSSREDIMHAYKTHLLTDGKAPASVYKFCLDLGMSEDFFYSHFGSFDSVERAIWKSFIDNTIGRLQADASFSQFSAHEKVLAFYYTLFEIFKTDRSFILLQWGQNKSFAITPSFLKDLKKTFEDFMAELLSQGQQSGEVANRPYLDKRYPQLFWAHFGTILMYWKNDESAGFEKTDAYIEKTVRLAFELISKGVIDSAFDLAKFIYQR